MKKLYLKEVMEQHHIKLTSGVINLIQADCGCGKTTYIMDFIKNSTDDIIYVCDTQALKDNILQEFASLIGDKTILKQWDNGHYSLDYYHPSYDDYSHIDFMTYASFGDYISNQGGELIRLGLNTPTIVLDEAHQVIKYADIYEQDEEGNYTRALDFITDEEILNRCLIIALTATPDELLNEDYIEQDLIHDVLGKHKYELKAYQHKHELPYSGKLEDLLSKIKNKHNKVLVFTSGLVQTMIDKRNELEKLGYDVECLYSPKPQNPEFTDKRQAVYDELIQFGTLGCKILIINAGYMSGINIENGDIQEVDTYIYDSRVEHQQDYIRIQSLGRIRHDIDTVYIRMNIRDITKDVKDDIELQRKIDLIESVLGQKLSTKEFKALATELNFRTKTRKQNMKPYDEIRALGYEVQEPTNSKRYTVISK